MKREPDYSVASTPIDEDYEDEASAKRQRRLAKNREIAKNCRRRKKERKAAIQEEVNESLGWILMLLRFYSCARRMGSCGSS